MTTKSKKIIILSLPLLFLAVSFVLLKEDNRTTNQTHKKTKDLNLSLKDLKSPAISPTREVATTKKVFKAEENKVLNKNEPHIHNDDCLESIKNGLEISEKNALSEKELEELNKIIEEETRLFEAQALKTFESNVLDENGEHYISKDELEDEFQDLIDEAGEGTPVSAFEDDVPFNL